MLISIVVYSIYEVNTMNIEMAKKFGNFKNRVVYNDRFFISDDEFLLEIKKQIDEDLTRSVPQIIKTLHKGTRIFRARAYNQSSSAVAYMENYINEYECSKKCVDVKNDEKPQNMCDFSLDNAHFFKKAASKIVKNNSDSDNGFNGYGKKDSSLPPIEKSQYVSDMRANPKYIRYLYAASDIYTALLESRSNIKSLVSVAEIEITDDMRILDITDFPDTNERLSSLLSELNCAFSTPANGELKDYLPSQVISEYIKCFNCFPKIEGICFHSSLNSDGKNYTIFSEGKYTPISSEVYYVHKLGLTAYSVTEENDCVINNSSGVCEI